MWSINLQPEWQNKLHYFTFLNVTLKPKVTMQVSHALVYLPHHLTLFCPGQNIARAGAEQETAPCGSE